MKILAANDLKHGHPVWWTGKGWSRDIHLAIRLEPALAETLAAERLVHDATLIATLEIEDAHNRRGEPLRRQIIRATGPTVRTDLHVDLAKAA